MSEKMIHPLLDEKKQKKARRYEKEKRLLGLASMALSFVILLFFHFSGLSSWLANLQIGSSVIWIFLLYIFVFQVIFVVFSLPVEFYAGFIHEHRWNFSNQTLKSWAWERLKSFFVSTILLFIVLGLLFWIMDLFPQWWWLIAGVAFTLLSVVLATLFPVVILPVFNKYTQINDKELIESLEKILTRGGLKSSGFFKEDMSRQTKKENAFLAGLGKTRRVVLGDNLLKKMNVPEIESILAHEVGHYKFRHVWKNLFIGSLQSLIVFFIIHLVMKILFVQFLTSIRTNLTLFPIMIVFGGVIYFFLFSLMSHAISRRFEREADRYSLEEVSDKRVFMTALAGLADRNLSNAYPEWWVKLLFYSHPPIGERLEMAEDFIK